MKLETLVEHMIKESGGTYDAVTFSEGTDKRIKKFVDDHHIPNPLSPKKYHCTVIYSKKYLPTFKAMGKIEPHWIGTPTKLDIFKTAEGSNCLVLRFDCKDVVDRHHFVMKKYGATYDHPVFKNHITLSYDIGDDFDIKPLQSFVKNIGPIEIIEEYSEGLDE